MPSSPRKTRKRRSPLPVVSPHSFKKRKTTNRRSRSLELGYCVEEDIVEYVPSGYLRMKLNEMGAYFFNRPIGASCKLLVVSTLKEPTGEYPKEFWAHEEYLSVKSLWFRDFFEKYYLEDRASDPRYDKVRCGDEVLLRIRIHIAYPGLSHFEEILRWIYTNDDMHWMRNGFNPGNYRLVAYNVQMLGLGPRAMAVCRRYATAVETVNKQLQEQQCQQFRLLQERAQALSRAQRSINQVTEDQQLKT